LQAPCSTQSSRVWHSRLSVTAVCALLLSACGESHRDRQLDYFAFGTEVSISLYGVSDLQASEAEQQLQAYFAEVGQDWYPWLPGELQRVNDALALGQAATVAPALARVMHRAADIETLSGNTFNAGLGRLSELWGLHDLTAPSQLPHPAAIDALLDSRNSLTEVRWDGDQISSASTLLMIDLGGIAKGAILEQSTQVLRGLGIANAIVNIGGDLSVLGDVNGRPARIGIRSPAAENPVAALDVDSGETVVTSGNYERFVEINGRRFTHVLDPRTGYPVEHTAAVTVVHTDAMLADAAATALMVGGAREFEALTRALGIDFALLIETGGDLRLTPAMRERLDWAD
jgi:thiamine biosynthesis lipoprotein